MVKMPEMKPKDFNHKAMALAFNLLVDKVHELSEKVDALMLEKQHADLDDQFAELDAEIKADSQEPEIVVLEKTKRKKAKG